MTISELFSVQQSMGELKSLYIELANHEQFNPYKGNVITDMPKGSNGKNFSEWYVEEKDRIEREIKYYKDKVQQDRKILNDFIDGLDYPDSEIVRYRAINNLSWTEIGELLNMDRRTASRKFYAVAESCPQCPLDT